MIRLFRLLSSVRLAVPLLLVLAVVVAIGTVLESSYSAAYAKLLVYDTVWFYAIMGLLALNILCAALSRLPWKARHTGFVITHAGMLLMLSGAYVTARWGIDGELRIEEGQAASVIGLPGLELTVFENDRILSRTQVPRYLKPRDADQLKWLNEKSGIGLNFKSYQPFTLPNEEYVAASADEDAAPAISFWLRSRFFNTSEWLQAKDRADLEMGPARLRLIVDKESPAPVADHAELRVLSRQDGSVLRSVKLESLKAGPIQIGTTRIRLVQVFENASVVGNKLVEKGGQSLNPAVELELTTPKGSVREVSFANFMDFSLVKDPGINLRFEYRPAAPRRPDSNLIEFHVSPKGEFRLELYKGGQLVLKENVDEGSLIETPWMGMKIVVARIISKSVRKQSVKALASPPKGVLPPSAFEISLASNPGESYWLSEGDTLEVPSREHVYRVTYGFKSMKLPFSVHLNRFIRQDYPGTEKALSFESHVRVPEVNEASVISMNNPLVRAGFTLYQSSFQMLPGRPPVSILSVNRDPGRYIKYLGGIVTSVGILIFTLMRSRFWLWFRRQR